MRILVLAAVVLGGCALTPAEVEEQGARREWTGTLPPSAAADCIARNAENVHSAIAATVRTGSAPGSFEVVARQGEAGVSALSRVTASGAGSRVTTWLSPNVLSPDRYLAALSKGC